MRRGGSTLLIASTAWLALLALVSLGQSGAEAASVRAHTPDALDLNWHTDGRTAPAHDRQPALRLAANSVDDIIGRYNSVITTKRGKRRGVVRLEQNGDEITGVFEKKGHRIVGTRNGDTIVFEWFVDGAGYDLIGKWKIKADGTEIVGRWERPDGAHGGKWILTRIE